MRTIAPLATLMLSFAGLVLGMQAAKGIVPTYELYSWQDDRNVWTFCLLYTTDRQKTPEEIFGGKNAVHGVDQLKRSIAKLPGKSRIVWFDQLTLGGVTVKGTERLKYPPKEVIDAVRHFAGQHDIEVLGP